MTFVVWSRQNNLPNRKLLAIIAVSRRAPRSGATPLIETLFHEAINMKVRVFLVEYQDGKIRRLWNESLSSQVAYALGRELAKRGRKPTVRRIDLPQHQVAELLVRFEFISSADHRPRRKLL